jgi:hypothetical protein
LPLQTQQKHNFSAATNPSTYRRVGGAIGNGKQLRNLGVAKGGANLAGYSNLLDAGAHRLSVTELSGRAVNYGYGNLYRLTRSYLALLTSSQLH